MIRVHLVAAALLIATPAATIARPASPGALNRHLIRRLIATAIARPIGLVAAPLRGAGANTLADLPRVVTDRMVGREPRSRLL